MKLIRQKLKFIELIWKLIRLAAWKNEILHKEYSDVFHLYQLYSFLYLFCLLSVIIQLL